MTKKFKKISIAILSALLLVALVVSSIVALADSSSTAVWSDISLAETYAHNTTFEVPSRSVTVGGKTVSATSQLFFPDGTVTSQTSVTLSQCGTYTIKYTAAVDGKVYLKSVDFTVEYGLYTLSSNRSSASYGTYQHATESGLLVRLAEGDSITFTPIIDINNVTNQIELVRAFATPDNKGSADFRRLIFTFTDIEDPNNYLRISARQSAEGDNYPITYFLAGGNGQPLVGWEESWGRLHIDNEWGEQAQHSFSLLFTNNIAVWQDKPANERPISLRFDSESLSVYTNGTRIVDLDNPQYFSALWSGFKSGLVRLSIQADSYVGTTANFCVSKVKDILDLSATKTEDNQPPVITIDNSYQTMPVGKVGASYPIPTATARDLYSGDCDVKVSVFYNYTSSNATSIKVEDGAFTCNYGGQYAIVYETTDVMGNVAREILWVNATQTLPAPQINLSGSIERGTVGYLIVPRDYQVISSSGDATVTITAKRQGSDTVINVPTTGFRPERAGTYTITYRAVDYIGQVTEVSYDVEVVMHSKPIFTDAPIMPQVLISGSQYLLPELIAYDYRSGERVEKVASATVIDANGSTKVSAGGTFTPEVANTGDMVEIIYECEGATYPSIKLPTIVAWQEENGRPRLQLQNYFYSADNSISVAKSSGEVTITTNTADGSWIFANSMIAGSFEVQLRGLSDKAKYQALNVTFTDSMDPSISIQAQIINNEPKADIIVDGVKVGLYGSLNNGSYTLRIGYNRNCITVDNASLPVSKTIDGKDFNGFPSNKLYVSIQFVGATKGAGYDILTMNGHAMNDMTADRTAPKIVVMGDYGGSLQIGQVVTLPMALTSDVTDPNTTLYMSVLDKDNQPIKDVNGTLLENVDPSITYDIKLDDFGQYSVVITSSDTFNRMANEAVFRYALNVDDNIAPTITYLAGYKREPVVGDTIVIPQIEVKDNVSSADEIRVSYYVYTPSGYLMTIPSSSNSFKVTEVGVYEVRIMAVDKAGNVNLLRTPITVNNK